MNDARADDVEPIDSVALLTHSVMLERCIPGWAWVVTILLGLLMLMLFVAGFALLLVSTSSLLAVFMMPFGLLCFGLIIPISQAADHLNDTETWLRRARRKQYCPFCQYDTRHLSSSTCPECGFDFSILTRRKGIFV
jgi:hypothetical protein